MKLNIQGILAIIALCFAGVYGLVKGEVPTWLIGIATSAVLYFYVAQQKKETVKALIRRNVNLLRVGGSLDDVVNKWLPFPRCWSHIVLAIVVGTIWTLGTGGAILAGVLAYLFVAYQKRQDANCLTQSYLDIREFAVTVTITVLVMVGLMFAGVIPGIYHFTPL